jgi:hypothetical protein
MRYHRSFVDLVVELAINFSKLIGHAFQDGLETRLANELSAGIRHVFEEVHLLFVCASKSFVGRLLRVGQMRPGDNANEPMIAAQISAFIARPPRSFGPPQATPGERDRSVRRTRRA